jgi:aminoglycoside phosphotransferase family enzyme
MMFDTIDSRGSSDPAYFRNRYLEISGDYAGLKVLELYWSTALVRANELRLRAGRLERDEAAPSISWRKVGSGQI